MQKLKWILPSLILVAALSTGCSAGSAEASGMDMAAGSKAAVETANYDNANAPAARLASQGTADPQLGEAARASRAVIRNGVLSVRVPDVEKAEKEVEKYVSSLGGFVSSSASTNLTSSAPSITMKLRVPVGSFDKAMEYFESKGTRLEKQTNGEDVTAKIVDFDARLKIMLAQESSFRNMLSKSNNSQEALDLQTRLMNLRAEIESLSSQRKTLSDLASLSTIDLSLVSETRSIAQTGDQGWAQESWNSATTALGSAGRTVGTLLVYVLVFAPFWAPVAFLIWRKAARTRTRPGFEM